MTDNMMIVGTALKRSASNLKPAFSATTIFLRWDVSMLCMTTKAYDNRYWFDEVCFESETKGFCINHCFIQKRLSVVHKGKSLGSSVLIWKGLLRVWNQRFLQQPFSHCETSQCCPWRPEPRNIGADLKRSASNMKPTFSAATGSLWWNVSSTTAKA